jgi:hypothetical protein
MSLYVGIAWKERTSLRDGLMKRSYEITSAQVSTGAQVTTRKPYFLIHASRRMVSGLMLKPVANCEHISCHQDDSVWTGTAGRRRGASFSGLPSHFENGILSSSGYQTLTGRRRICRGISSRGPLQPTRATTAMRATFDLLCRSQKGSLVFILWARGRTFCPKGPCSVRASCGPNGPSFVPLGFHQMQTNNASAELSSNGFSRA